jgi:hypothetical protein
LQHAYFINGGKTFCSAHSQVCQSCGSRGHCVLYCCLIMAFSVMKLVEMHAFELLPYLYLFHISYVACANVKSIQPVAVGILRCLNCLYCQRDSSFGYFF